MKSEWQIIKVGDATEMQIFVARPDSDAKLPGIIILQEIFGVNHHIRSVAERFAAVGFVAVAPELFHRTAPIGAELDYVNDIEKGKTHMNALTNKNLEDDLRAAYEALKNLPGVAANKIAVSGYCLGGKAAFIANGILPVQAAISYYGSGIPTVLGDYVAKQNAPLLMFWGGQDKNMDAGKRGRIAEALHKEGKVFRDVEFSDAGHAFFCDERSAYNARAAEESWALLLAFLKNNLG